MLKTLVFLGLVVFCTVGQADVGAGPKPPCPSDLSIQAYHATNNCSYYWQCSNGVPYLMPCAPGTHWEQSLWTCVHIAQSTCIGEGWSTTNAPSTSTPEVTGSGGPPVDDEYPDLGYFLHLDCPTVDGPDPVFFPHKDCSMFWLCSNGVAHRFDCPSGLHFNPTLEVCDWPHQAGCSAGKITSRDALKKPCK